tara:strand:+ start:135 stop:311 length:177 start_codon:yes stop_codon:yes gene_type:complete
MSSPFQKSFSSKSPMKKDSWWSKIKKQFTPTDYSGSSNVKRDVKTKVNESGMPSRRGK